MAKGMKHRPPGHYDPGCDDALRCRPRLPDPDGIKGGCPDLDVCDMCGRRLCKDVSVTLDDELLCVPCAGPFWNVPQEDGDVEPVSRQIDDITRIAGDSHEFTRTTIRRKNT